MARPTLDFMGLQTPLFQLPPMRTAVVDAPPPHRGGGRRRSCDRCRGLKKWCSGDAGDGTCCTRCRHKGIRTGGCNFTQSANNDPNARSTESDDTPARFAHASNLVVANPRPRGRRVRATYLEPASIRPIYDRRVKLPFLPIMGFSPWDEFTKPSRWAIARSTRNDDLREPTNTALWALQNINHCAFGSLPLPSYDEMLPDPVFPAVKPDMVEPRPELDKHIGPDLGLYVPTASGARDLVYRPQQCAQVKEPQQPAELTLAFRGRVPH